jgi:hypothetical protein
MDPTMAAEQVVVQAVFRAAMEGDLDMVAGMLEEDPGLLSSVWCFGTLLNRAMSNGHVECVRLLLERGAEVNKADDLGGTALEYAVGRGHEEMVSILVASGADLSRRGHTALMSASSGGHVAVVRLLLRSMRVVGPDERDVYGRTAV